MIEAATLAEQRTDPALEPVSCPRCRQPLFRAWLTTGSVVQFRCFRTVKVDAAGRLLPIGAAGGKRERCGALVRLGR